MIILLDQRIFGLIQYCVDLVVSQLPQYINNCPRPSRIFHGRQTILDQMHQYFTVNKGKQDIFVLHGLGGAGKTQIALKFIAESASRSEVNLFIFSFTNIFFIDSSSIDTIDTGLKNIAKTKSIGDSSQDALQWLRNKQEEWLLFFDNADDPKINLNAHFPQCDHGNILITSRNPGLCVYAGSHSVVSDMEEKDAVDLLLRSTVQDTTVQNKTTAGEIVLQYLPLAIIQAGAFISKSGALNSYLVLYEHNRAQLLSERPAQLHDDYAWTVYTTWQISFQQLSQPAAMFLQLCSLIHHQGISEQIFKNAMNYRFGASSPSNEELQTPIEFLSQFLGPDGVWDSLCFMDVTNEVRAFSLINFASEQNQFSIHPLVHDWTRSTLSNEESYQCCMVAIIGMSLTGLSESDTELASLWMLPHIDFLLQHNSNIIPDFRHEYGKIYALRGKPEKAEELQVEVLNKRRNVLGEDHLDTLEAILATILIKQGKLKEAEELSLVVLEKRRNVSGDNHPDTHTAMSELAFTCNLLGKSKEAESMEVLVLEKRRDILGDNHPDTFQAMGNLTSTYQNLGKLNEAEELGVAVVEKARNLLGDHHPHTLIVMGNLAVTYNMQRKFQEAEQLQVVVLERR
ncbi:P-loop containing nucleoside triphosphate hydrolase protein, partial [Mycena epipterygia]